MRKIILIAAMVLVSASAQAGDRSLSMATANDATLAPQATTATTAATTQVSEAAPVTDAAKYVDRPPAVSTTAPAASTATTSAPTAPQPAPKSTARADKPKHKRTWTEGRIISELHRHGVYW